MGLLAHLRANGINGPFMILGPLSVLPNWVSEVERWCPSLPVILYHGSRQERAELRARHMPTGEARRVREWRAGRLLSRLPTQRLSCMPCMHAQRAHACIGAFVFEKPKCHTRCLSRAHHARPPPSPQAPRAPTSP